MYMSGIGLFIGVLGFLLWLAFVIYVLVLETRLVAAVEKNAEKDRE